MSRNCEDCTLDGCCELQANRTVACSNGREKTKEQRLRDIDDAVINVIERLDSISNQYASWDQWDKTKIIRKAANVLKTAYEERIMFLFDREETEIELIKVAGETEAGRIMRIIRLQPEEKHIEFMNKVHDSICWGADCTNWEDIEDIENEYSKRFINTES